MVQPDQFRIENRHQSHRWMSPDTFKVEKVNNSRGFKSSQNTKRNLDDTNKSFPSCMRSYTDNMTLANSEI